MSNRYNGMMNLEVTMGRKPISLEIVKQRLWDRFQSQVTLIDSTYTTVAKKATFIDDKFGTWNAKVSHVLGGGQHPLRGKETSSKKNSLSPDIWRDRVYVAHGSTVWLDEATLQETKCRFIDVDFGEWWARIDHVVSGQQHPKRTKTYTPTLLEYQVILAKRSNPRIELYSESYTNLTSFAKFHDPEFGDWIAKAGNVLAGSGHPQRARINKRLPVDNVIDRIKVVHGDQVVLDVSSYTDANTHAIFLDKKYGNWLASPANVMRGRSHPARKNQKSAKTQKKFPPVIHWKTQNLCFSSSSYEYATLNWLTQHRYDFDWQIPFEMPILTANGKRRIYTVDLFIKDGPHAGKYIEIKGYFRQSCREKWEWLNLHQYCELWTQDKLRALGILFD